MTDQPPARDVILAALATTMPKDADLKDRAALIEAALIDHDYLPNPNVAPPTADDYIEVAKWLADQGNHPRHVGVEDGWRKLLLSDTDVYLATAAAVQRVGPSTEKQVKDAAEMLHRYHREQRYIE